MSPEVTMRSEIAKRACRVSPLGPLAEHMAAAQTVIGLYLWRVGFGNGGGRGCHLGSGLGNSLLVTSTLLFTPIPPITLCMAVPTVKGYFPLQLAEGVGFPEENSQFERPRAPFGGGGLLALPWRSSSLAEDGL